MSVQLCDICGCRWGGLVSKDYPTLSDCPFCIRKTNLHYKNGREAKNGDKAAWISDYGVAVVGILYDAKAGNDHCNGRLAPILPNDPGPNLKECLHLDDVKEALKSLEVKKT